MARKQPGWKPKRPDVVAALQGMDDLPPLDSDSLDLVDCVETRTSQWSNTGSNGRPQTYTVILPKGVQASHIMRKDGLSIQSIAYRLGVSDRTFRDCIRRQPELQEAIHAGHARQQDYLVRLLMKGALAGFYPAAMFLLKGFHGIRENDAPQNNTSNVVIHLPASMSMEDLKRLAEAGVDPMQLPAPKTLDEFIDEHETTYDAEGNEVVP